MVFLNVELARTKITVYIYIYTVLANPA